MREGGKEEGNKRGRQKRKKNRKQLVVVFIFPQTKLFFKVL